MDRRDLLKAIAAGGALATVGCSAYASPSGWREFEITYRVKLATAAHAGAAMAAGAAGCAGLPAARRPHLGLTGRSLIAVGSGVAGAGRRRGLDGARYPREIEVTARVATRDRRAFTDASRKSWQSIAPDPELAD